MLLMYANHSFLFMFSQSKPTNLFAQLFRRTEAARSLLYVNENCVDDADDEDEEKEDDETDLHGAMGKC